jgi:hypothetical protein
MPLRIPRSLSRFCLASSRMPSRFRDATFTSPAAAAAASVSAARSAVRPPEPCVCHGGCINLYYQNVIPKPYRKWYHISYYIIVWVLMEIVYSIFIGIISSKIVSKIAGIGIQCRRDSCL